MKEYMTRQPGRKGPEWQKARPQGSAVTNEYMTRKPQTLQGK